MSIQWVVSAAEAKQLMPEATILDTRNLVAWVLGHIQGAVHVTWQQFSQPRLPNKGKLIENPSTLEQKLRAVGIFNTKPVIVIGDPPHNFGEEGRIVWMLRTLGHAQAVFVDGGHAALVLAGIPIQRGLTQPQAKGDFVVQRTGLWEIQRDELKTYLAAGWVPNFCTIDTREPREYAGATPYGEQRGGHIPGAVNLYFKDLMDVNGYLLPREQMLAKLNQIGLDPHTTITTYCTGGIRSAWVVGVLSDLGFKNVKNYAGSMWEWSASASNDYPLI